MGRRPEPQNVGGEIGRDRQGRENKRPEAGKLDGAKASPEGIENQAEPESQVDAEAAGADGQGGSPKEDRSTGILMTDGGETGVEETGAAPPEALEERGGEEGGQPSGRPGGGQDIDPKTPPAEDQIFLVHRRETIATTMTRKFSVRTEADMNTA